MKTPMLRKIVLALGATAVIGAAAMAPTAASAAGGWHGHHGRHHGWHHRWHRGFGVRFLPPPYYGNCYIVRRVVWTRHGKRIRRVEVCE